MSYQRQCAAANCNTSLRTMIRLFCAAMLATTIMAQAQTFTVLHTFRGGTRPYAGVTMDAAGNLDGTTYYGGANGTGLVYKLAHKGSGWVLSPLYSFQRGLDGQLPVGGVTIGSDGDLYGTTSSGGRHGGGTVYKLSPPATFCGSILCPWTETLLYQFTNGADGGQPDAAVIFDRAGNLYGTTYYGGIGRNGVVFKLTPSVSGWTESVLHSFNGSPDGAHPYSALTFDDNGNLYGTTEDGGTGFGTVYGLTPSGSNWTEQVIYVFQGSLDGAYPTAGVVLDPEGNVYGTTQFKGVDDGGTVFGLMPSNGNWSFSLLYSPVQGGSDAVGTLARSSSGTLYGTFFYGGLFQSCGGEGCGNVFQLSPSNGGWVYTSLYEFTGGDDGGNPTGGLILDSAGNLYGTTSGLQAGVGSAFELAP
jgi:uncharacterized repeat protein (TIGR03803 family)